MTTEAIKQQILEICMSKCLALDTESTGLDPTTAEICELAIFQRAGKHLLQKDQLFDTLEPIPFAASAKNNISRAMIRGYSTFASELVNFESFDILHDIVQSEYLVAHNYVYDKKILVSSASRQNQEPIAQAIESNKWICTMRLAKHLFKANEQDPNLSYSLNYLRYAFDLPCEGLSTHRASDDTKTCWYLFEHIARYILDNMLEPSELTEDFDLAQFMSDLCYEPIEILVMPFGKHKSQPLSEIPQSYWDWLLTKSDLLNETHEGYDPDLAAAVERELNRRLEKNG